MALHICHPCCSRHRLRRLHIHSHIFIFLTQKKYPRKSQILSTLFGSCYMLPSRVGSPIRKPMSSRVGCSNRRACAPFFGYPGLNRYSRIDRSILTGGNNARRTSPVSATSNGHQLGGVDKPALEEGVRQTSQTRGSRGLTRT